MLVGRCCGALDWMALSACDCDSSICSHLRMSNIAFHQSAVLICVHRAGPVSLPTYVLMGNCGCMCGS